ncbi:MAG: DUF1844 domain-containing protein [Fimbriimonadia bacterium]|jgi:CheY-specific phosphatase CheX
MDESDTTQTPEEQPAETSDTSPPHEPVSVFVFAYQMLHAFNDLAYQRMGLQTDLIAGKVVKNMEEAKAAVDIASSMADTLLPHLDGADQRAVRNLITNLRINFARQSQPSAQVESD